MTISVSCAVVERTSNIGIRPGPSSRKRVIGRLEHALLPRVDGTSLPER